MTIRLLGLALERLGDFHTAETRNAALFRALAAEHEVPAVLRPPGLSRWHDAALVARHVYPSRWGWRARAGLNASRFHHYTRAIEPELRRWEGRYDLLFELQTLFAPGTGFRNRRYVIYTDNILPLTLRYFRDWAPLSRREQRRWIELEGEVCRSAATVFAMSRFLRDSLIEDYGVSPNRVVAVGGGSNTLAADLEGKSWDSQIALFVGINWEMKAGPLLLRAWRRVRAEVPAAELWIAGPERPQGDAPGVRWLGRVDRSTLEAAYDRAALFVLPSHFEPWGHVILEAMGRGVPCVGVDRFGMPDMIRPGETGVLIQPGAEAELAEALIGLLGNPESAERLGRAAYASVREQHTWADVVARMRPALEASISRP